MQKKALKYLKISLLAAFTAIFFNVLASAAQSSLPISGQPFQNASLPTPPQGKTGQQVAIDLALGGLRYVKVIMVVIGILYITITGTRLVIAGGEEENVGNSKKAITAIIIGFIMISMSQDIARVFDMQDSSILSSPQTILQRVRLFDRQVELFITFLKATIAIFAVLMIIRSASLLIVRGDDEETVSKEKKSILFSAAGLILLNLGSIFIERVFYKVDRDIYSGITGVQPGIDAKEGVEQIAGITNLIVSFVGPVAVLMLIIGAFMYLTARDDEEQVNKAKRLIFTTVIGIVIIFGAFALVSTILSSRLANIGAITEG